MVRKKKKVAIITGVSSFLGKSTAKYLLSKGFIVFGIVRPNSFKIDTVKKIKGLHLIFIDFDNLNIEDCDKILCTDTKNIINDINNKNLDITFIHFGWAATLDRNNFEKQILNVDMSIKALEFAKLIHTNRFIFAGSQAELSKTAYGISKKQFSDIALNHIINSNMNFIHLRIFSIYGKDDRENSLIKILVKTCKENEDMSLSSCEYKWNYLYIDDFTNILYKMIIKNINTGTYDIASNDTRLLKEYVIEAKNVLNSKSNLKFGDRPDSSETFAIPNISNLINSIGKYNFKPFKEGILEV